MIAAARLAFGCGAVLGLVEAARAMLALPHLNPLDALLISAYSALGGGLLAGAAALAVAPLWRAVGRRLGAPAGADRVDGGGVVLATAVAAGTLLVVLRARTILGYGQPELAHLLTGPLLEGLAAGGLVAIVAGRTSPRRLLFGWRIAGGIALAVVATAAFAERIRGARSGASTSATAPNVLLVSIDTLRADHVGAYGRAPSFTPNLDRLASEGVVFETVRAPVALTGPSHTTMLTGLYPAHHGARVNALPLREEVETLPEILARRGYRTAGFVSGWTLTHRASGLATRFQWYDEDLSATPLFPDAVQQVPLLWLLDRSLLFVAQRGRSAGEVGRFRGPAQERPGERTVDRARRWLTRHRGERFFLFVHLFEPHGPYAPSAAHRRAVDPDYGGDLVAFAGMADRRAREALAADPASVARIRRLYEAEVADADEAVGRLLDAVRDLGLADRTLVVLTADHGEGLGEHGEFFEHDYLYETTLRVPLVVRLADGAFAGTRVTAPVRLVDLAPTILDFTGGAFSSPLDGASLRELLAGRDGTPRTAFGSNEEGWQSGSSLHYVEAGGAKLIWTLDHRWGVAREPAHEELFDLIADPQESHDLARGPDLPGVSGPLRDLLRRWIAQTSSPTAFARDAEAQRQLRSLGYL